MSVPRGGANDSLRGSASMHVLSPRGDISRRRAREAQRRPSEISFRFLSTGSMKRIATVKWQDHVHQLEILLFNDLVGESHTLQE